LRALTRRAVLSLAACAPALLRAAAVAIDEDPFTSAIERIRPLFKPKSPPAPGDWLEDHKEPGQTYTQFRAATPRPAVANYSTLRIVPIGPLSKGQSGVLGVVTDFMKPFFGLPLVLDPPVPLEAIPESAQRTQYFDDGPKQLLTSYLLNDVLMKRRQAKDAAVLGITALDLWPGEGWNFVFGQASLKNASASGRWRATATPTAARRCARSARFAP